jgi:hypothetical protein
MKIDRTSLSLVLLFVLAGAVGDILAADTYPTFSLSSVTFTVPTNTVGYQSDPANQVQSNAVYQVTGQLFTHPAPLQTIAQGYDQRTDTTTPWRTLTALFAAYQQGATNQAAIDSLYDTAGQTFVNSIYSNPRSLSAFQSFASSIKGMIVTLGYNVGTGFVAVVQTQTSDGNDILPFYFVQINGHYLISTFTSTQPRELNIPAAYGSGQAWVK